MLKKSKHKSFVVAGATLLGLAFAVVGGVSTANATEGGCVPSEAYSEVIPGSPATEAVYETRVVSEAGWQRYSRTGSWKHDYAPSFPEDRWQANVAGDPHGVGAEGAYFRSDENSGNVDWFYLEAIPAVTEQVLVTPAVHATEDVTVEHPAITCDPKVEDVCLNLDGIQEVIPEGMEAGPAVEGGPTCVSSDKPCPGLEECLTETVPPVIPPTTVEPVTEATLPVTGTSPLLPLIAGGGLLLTGLGLILRRVATA